MVRESKTPGQGERQTPPPLGRLEIPIFRVATCIFFWRFWSIFGPTFYDVAYCKGVPVYVFGG